VSTLYSLKLIKISAYEGLNPLIKQSYWKTLKKLYKNCGRKLWLNFSRNLSKFGELFFGGVIKFWQNFQESATEVSFF
jgi:hypothetical protein